MLYQEIWGSLYALEITVDHMPHLEFIVRKAMTSMTGAHTGYMMLSSLRNRTLGSFYQGKSDFFFLAVEVTQAMKELPQRKRRQWTKYGFSWVSAKHQSQLLVLPIFCVIENKDVLDYIWTPRNLREQGFASALLQLLPHVVSKAYQFVDNLHVNLLEWIPKETFLSSIERRLNRTFHRCDSDRIRELICHQFDWAGQKKVSYRFTLKKKPNDEVSLPNVLGKLLEYLERVFPPTYLFDPWVNSIHIRYCPFLSIQENEQLDVMFMRNNIPVELRMIIHQYMAWAESPDECKTIRLNEGYFNNSPYVNIHCTYCINGSSWHKDERILVAAAFLKCHEADIDIEKLDIRSCEVTRKIVQAYREM